MEKTIKELTNNIIHDIKIDLQDEFEQNFRRKAFFTEKWDKTEFYNSSGTLLQRSNKLRRSINAKMKDNQIVFTSNVSYAKIHNEGGIIVVTPRMKRFFWAKYRETAGAITYNIKQKRAAKTKRNIRLTAESKKWKALALMTVGQKITIPKRQFIGLDHPNVDNLIKENIAHNVEELNKKTNKNLKQK